MIRHLLTFIFVVLSIYVYGQESGLANYEEEIYGVQFNMIAIQGGTFRMGCTDGSTNCWDDEYPVHEVTIRPFYMGQTEVTQARWRAIMGSNTEELNNTGCNECPVERVNWEEAKAFIQKLNDLTGGNYRLQSEAEWEYAARGGQSYAYAGSDDLNAVGWYLENYEDSSYGSEGTTHPVGTKLANGYGLYDMSGNLWEWCEDDWHERYYRVPTDGSAWVDSPRGDARVVRGGAWGSYNVYCRVSCREFSNQGSRDSGIGFRMAASQ